MQQARARSGGLGVDVPNGNVDRAWRALTRRLNDEKYMETAQGKKHFVKPSERRKQEKSAAAKRFRDQEFKCASAGEGWVWVAQCSVHACVPGLQQLTPRPTSSPNMLLQRHAAVDHAPP